MSAQSTPRTDTALAAVRSVSNVLETSSGAPALADMMRQMEIELSAKIAQLQKDALALCLIIEDEFPESDERATFAANVKKSLQKETGCGHE